MKKIVFSLLCSAAIAAATPVSTNSTVNVTYINAGTPAVLDSANDYVGPYTLKVNGVNTAAMCINDYNFTSGSWNADVTNVTSGNLGNTYLGNSTFNVDGYQISSSEVYQAEAYIFSEIVKPNADRTDLQDAAWTIMDDITGHNPHSNNTAVNNIIADVVANAGSFNASNYEILSQVDPGSNREQEFIIASPEPATWSLLGGALFLFGLTRFRSRRSKQAAEVR